MPAGRFGLRSTLPAVVELYLSANAVIDQAIGAQKTSPKNDLMPLLPLLELHPCKGLEEKTVEVGHPNSRCIDVRVVTTANPANLAFVSYGETERSSEIVIDTIAPCPRVDERTNPLHRQIGLAVSRLSALETDIHL